MPGQILPLRGTVERDLRHLFDTVIERYWSSIDLGEFAVLRARGDPFSVLVAVVLSQNTSDVNATRAYESLVRRVGRPVRPEALLEIGVEGIAEAVRVSGMQRIKARTIVGLARSVSVRELEELDPLELRSRLLSVPGVGYKTADVFLLMYRRYPVFPMDTHIRRVLTRYGVARPGEDYEAVRRTVEALLPRDPDYLLKAHLSLIEHGRTVCKARRPRCSECPVSDGCAKAFS